LSPLGGSWGNGGRLGEISAVSGRCPTDPLAGHRGLAATGLIARSLARRYERTRAKVVMRRPPLTAPETAMWRDFGFGMVYREERRD
jgi:hypothetical protein